MLKSSVQNFKHDFTIMWDKHNCPTIWTFFTTTLLGNLDESESESESHSVVSDSWQPHGLYRPWNSPGQNTGVGNPSLLQGIFLTQVLNPGLPHCRRILYQLSYQGSSLLCSDSMDISRAVIASLRASLFRVRLMGIKGCLNPHTEKLP